MGRDNAKVCAKCFLRGLALVCPDDEKGQEIAKNLLILSGDDIPNEWMINSVNKLFDIWKGQAKSNNRLHATEYGA